MYYKKSLCFLLSVSIFLLCGCNLLNSTNNNKDTISLDNIPPYNNKAYIEVNGNMPFFTESEYTTTSYEIYSERDSLGRCGAAFACIGIDLMPTEERDSIGQIKPTGWQTVKYDIIDGKYLYNRCHLIGYQLAGENANPDNLITGTRYLNVEGMLPFENMVTDYVEETKNHVLYRATPIFSENNLLADGVLIEGYSVEDSGNGICFNVFTYNVQPGIYIDYSTGESTLADNQEHIDSKYINAESSFSSSNIKTNEKSVYILNNNTKKFHSENCTYAKNLKNIDTNIFEGNRDDLIAEGFTACKHCDP